MEITFLAAASFQDGQKDVGAIPEKLKEYVVKIVGMNNIFKGKILHIINDEVMIQSNNKGMRM
ncbi:MAG: hypothetical protein WA144_00705 [Candidatus Methanoperedens sp.]